MAKFYTKGVYLFINFQRQYIYFDLFIRNHDDVNKNVKNY